MHSPLIATPISHLFEDKSVGRRISSYSDCLEVRERSLRDDSLKQWLFHVDIDVTHPWNDEIKMYLKNIFFLKKDLRLVTFQATRCCTDHVISGGIFKMAGQHLSRDQMLKFAEINIAWLRSQLPDYIDIGLENNNYYPSEAYSIVCDGDFLTEIVKSNKIYFLLDIAHARVTAHNKGINYQSYIDTLPLEDIVQLHICEPFIPFSILEMAEDTHDYPSRAMLSEVKRLVNEYSHIKYLTIEYYKNPEYLISAILKLREIFSLPIKPIEHLE